MKYVHLSICTKDSYILNKTVSDMESDGFSLSYRGYDSVDLDREEAIFRQFMADVAEAEFMTIIVHGDTSFFKKFPRFRAVLEESGLSAILICTDDEVTRDFRHLFKGSDEDYRLALTYMSLGGENYRNLLLWSMRKYDGLDIEVDEPQVPPAQGIYYPGRGEIGFEDYLADLDPSKPNIGIFFYQKQWLNGNLDNIDGLIRAVEERGANPVAVFLHTYEEKISGAMGVKRILREILTCDGKPLLHAIIETMSFSQTLIASPGCGEQVSDDNFFLSYGVPVIQAMTLVSDEATWRAEVSGLSPAEIAYDIVHPEFDGQIITVPSSSTEVSSDGSRYYRSIRDRADRIADIAYRWAVLRMKHNPDRRVAILLYMYPPKNANAGAASGLDTLQSTVDLLHRMRDEGYDVGDSIPESSAELADILISGLTNDIDWVQDEDLEARALDMVDSDEYLSWYSALSDDARGKVEEGWGAPPGDVHVCKGRIAIPGAVFGNVLVGFQPDRGRDKQANYHDPDTVMPHQYIAYYRWLGNVFKADAVVHMGTHGTLEWLPGKSVALSGDCCPDYVLDSLPDIYPYVIGNPGEGIQAKRRGTAVIVDHMIPTMVRAGGYDELLELEGAIQTFMAARNQANSEGLSVIRESLRGIVADMEVYNDMKLPLECSDEEFDEAVDDLYDYVIELKENLIKDGLHVLGKVPEGRRLEEDIYSLTRLDNGDVPSMRTSIARALGYDLAELQDNPSSIDPVSGRLRGDVLEDVEVRDEDLIHLMAETGFDTGACVASAKSMYPADDGDLESCVRFVCDFLVPNLKAMGKETDSVIDALKGRYIEPGPAGCPTRGRAQLLPTGRNFYSIDPDAVPWRSSWDIGRRMADQMLERYLSEHGAYPDTVGIVIWATDTMKTGGDDIAYVLWLMGLRPVWAGFGGRVVDLEVIPLEELGRPRVDVALRISGLFRDTFPNLVEFIDRGVRTVAELDEDDAANRIRAHVRADVVDAIRDGIPEDRAREDALIRIFGDAPGTYGSGTNILIRTGDWKEVSDIGDIYRSYGQYAYGMGRKGECRPEAFRRNLGRMDVTVKNSVSREYDMLDNDDVYNDLGGFNAAVRSVRGEMPMSVIGCSADTSNLRTRTVDEESRFVFRSKIMNPKWLDGLKEHGFRGAAEISAMAEYVFAWDATSDIIDPWMYQSIAERFLFDEENAEWFRDANPHAMHDTAEWLLQAIGRGMWSPDPETRRQLEELYLELESGLEGQQ